MLSINRSLAVVGVAAAAVLVASPAAFAASSTTATPAGDAFAANLTSGTTADFTLGSYVVKCSTSATSGTVPAAPGNTNAAGPVNGPLANPTFTGCTINSILLNASTATNSTNGAWTIGLQYDPAGSTGTLTIPQGGVVVSIGGFVSCTVTVAPAGATSLTGSWTNGSASANPKLAFSNVSVPVSVSGSFLCPAATTATFSAGYDITDTTNPAAQIGVNA